MKSLLIPARFPRRGAQAFTLIEMVVSIAIMSVLMVALASTMMLATQAMPTADDGPSEIVETSQVAELFLSDITCARMLNVATRRTIEFTVADRNADTLDETIRYHWGGAAGDPFTRAYNSESPVTLLDTVHDLAVGYNDDGGSILPPPGGFSSGQSNGPPSGTIVRRIRLTLTPKDGTHTPVVFATHTLNGPVVP